MSYSTINKSASHFDVLKYDGNGATGSGQTISGLNFQPDMTWIKSTNTTDGHSVQDVVRGFGSTTKLSTYDNSQENDSGGGSYENYGYISAATSDGFTVVAGSNPGQANKSGNNYVSWNWKAGGTASSNSDGNNITSSVSANTTSGFSIVKWTGTGSASDTVGHGLGAIPDMIIVKKLSEDGDWFVFHKDLPQGEAMTLNNTHGQYSSTSQLPNGIVSESSVTSSVFGFTGSSDVNNVNKSGVTHVAYCFRNIEGFCKVGVFRGNGQADGTFIYTGMKPNFVITKKNGTADWLIRDNKRDFNGQWRDLYANNTSAHTSPDSNTQSDLLSNGFKLRMTHSNHNGSGDQYVYIAIGQTLVGSNNVPCTAR